MLNRTTLALFLALLVLGPVGCSNPPVAREADEAADAAAEPLGPDQPTEVDWDDAAVELAPDPEDEAPAPEPVRGDWLIGMLPNEMPHLNPLTSSDAYATTIMSQVFDTLLDRNPTTFAMEPHVAERYEVSDDHLVYTFYLRDDVVFSDGEPLTAEDVKFTYERIMDPEVDAPHLRNYYKNVVECEVLDPHTVRFTCSEPYYRHDVILGGIEILPAHIYSRGDDFNNHPNNRNPVGSGPYTLATWDTGQQLVLERNPNYWKEPEGEWPWFDRRIYKIITDSTVAFQVLARGDLDVAGVRPEDWVRGAEEPSFEERFTKYTYPQSAYTYIGWNMRRPLFEDKRVRRAMTMLLDRETIRDTIYEGLARIVTGNFMPGTPASNPEVEPWPFDPQAAQELLDEAGWVDSDGDGIRDRDGTPFRFEMLIGSGSSTAENVATIFQEELARVGIEMGIRQLEWASMLQRTTSREFDAMMMGWQMPPDPDPYQVWHSSQADAGSNYVGFEHARADDIIEQARVAFNDDERNALYREFHSIVHEEQPYTFMFNPLALLAVDKRVHNVNMYTYGPQSLEWFVPEPLQKY